MPASKARRSRRANPASARGGRLQKGKQNPSPSDKGMNVIPHVPRRNDTDIEARWAPIFPARTTRSLRYSTSAYLAGTSGVVASYVFSANGLYDPDITGSGHQPMGFDQMMLSYNHYTVTSCVLTATFHNFAASTPVISVKVDAGSTPSTVVDTIMEFGLNTHSVLESKSTFGSVKVLTIPLSLRKFEGVKDVVDVTDMQGTVAANPVEQAYFHIQCWDNAGVTTNVLVEYILEFRAVFLEPRVLTPSLALSLKDALVSEEEDKKTSPGEPSIRCLNDGRIPRSDLCCYDTLPKPEPGYGLESVLQLLSVIDDRTPDYPALSLVSGAPVSMLKAIRAQMVQLHLKNS